MIRGVTYSFEGRLSKYLQSTLPAVCVATDMGSMFLFGFRFVAFASYE